MKMIKFPSVSGLGSIETLLKGVLVSVLVIALWGFAGKRQMSKICNQINVKLENEEGNYFVDEDQIKDVISKGRQSLTFMRRYDSISLSKLEQRIAKIDFVKKAEVSHDLGGNLNIKVLLIKPIARIVSGGSDRDRYVGEEGEILPTSEKYCAKVITMDGPGARHMVYHTDSNALEMVHMIDFINNDNFWKAQISHINIDEHWNLTLYPLVGNQVIEFGPATDFKPKFNKLLAFYQRIVPVKGWNTYHKVSIKFKNQIICEKSS